MPKRSVTSLITAVIVTLASSHYTLPAFAQTSYEDLVEQQFAGIFAITSVLTDSEVITFGVMNFDPNEYLDLDDDRFGDQSSVETRNSLQTYTLPWRWKLTGDKNSWQTYAKIRLGYVHLKRDVSLFEDELPDRNKDSIYDLYGEYGWEVPLSQKWRAQFGAGLHLMHYSNNHKYRSDATRAYQPIFDDTLYNTRVTALMTEPLGKLTYHSESYGIPWAYQSALSYSFGYTIKTEDTMQETNPEAWRWANGVVAHFHLPTLYDTPNQLRVLARRIDVGGDVVNELDTYHYYELGVGWLADIKDRNNWFDNVGIGLSLNIGSSLSGGSVVLLYNEEY